MRICMVVYAYYFTDARVKGYSICLAEKGINVDILSLKEPFKRMKKERINEKITVYYLTEKYIGENIMAYLWSYIKFFFAAFWKLSILWLRNRYEVIHIHNMPNFIVFTAFIPKIFGSKLILDMHDIMSLTFKDKYPSKKIFTSLIKMEERVSSYFVNRILCADDFQKDFLIKERKISEKKITVIMNFPNLRVFKPHKKKKRNLYFKVVYHGTIAYRLGVDVILKAIAKIKDLIPIKFFLYGTGDYMEKCLEIIKNKNLQNTVYASKSFFSVEELPELLRDKDVGIIGNRKIPITKYLLPVKMMEYMAMGIPVIAPYLENIAYYFNEKMVCFYNPEDTDDLARKIILLYRSSKKRRRLYINALHYIKKHNWEQEFNKYMGVINGDQKSLS